MHGKGVRSDSPRNADWRYAPELLLETMAWRTISVIRFPKLILADRAIQVHLERDDLEERGQGGNRKELTGFCWA